MIFAAPVCPSLQVTVTLSVNVPAFEVSSCPAGELAPPESVHDWIPGPLESSAHENAVATD